MRQLCRRDDDLREFQTFSIKYRRLLNKSNLSTGSVRTAENITQAQKNKTELEQNNAIQTLA